MTLDSAPEATPTDPTCCIPLVGTTTTEDGDSDSEPAVDIEEYDDEDNDPVCRMTENYLFSKPFTMYILHGGGSDPWTAICPVPYVLCVV